jgi:membrane-anchored glycerophosphoryl diester phosphodiesterase (GDPDase)
MLYTLFLWIYISFSLNGHIKTKNEYFHKILKNNWDKRQKNALFLVLFFCLMPVKSESLKISSQTNMIYIHQQFF